MTYGRLTAGAIASAALLFLVLHLAAGTGVLDDLDAINFAMGLRDFDVARHQPHPPGYPIYIAIGKLVDGARLALGAGGGIPGVPHEAAALGLIGIVCGAVAAWPLFVLFRRLGMDGPVACGATLVTMACPLYWITASRPLSDMPGLAAAVAVQAILATAFARQAGWHQREVTPAELAATGRLIVIGALLAGLAAGLRSQTVWLTLPLLVTVIVDRAGRGAAGAIVGSAITFAAGVLLWLVPLAVVSGGPLAYWRALTSQAGEDFEGVDMLLTSTQPIRRLAFNLYETFVLPWASLPLAIVVLLFAVAGAMWLLRHDRRRLTLLAGLAGPYAVFHLLVQENVTTRYALPLVPAVSFLAVRGAGVLFRQWTPLAAGVIAAALLVVAHPALMAYGAAPAPIFRVFADMLAAEGLNARGEGAQPADADRPVVAMHRRVFTESRRAREWMGPSGFPWRLLPAPRGHEWLELVEYWRGGGRGRVWFLADARRSDLALIDPASRHHNGYYGWTFGEAAAVLGGARPNEMDWVVIDSPPAWFLGEGWSLTPETSGVADESRRGPAQGGIEGWVRRQESPLRLVIGGRNLGAAGDPDVRFTLAIDGRTLDEWTVAPAPGFFLRSLDLPAGALEGGDGLPLARLFVTAAAADGTDRPVQAAVEQFDLQPPDRVQFAFDLGWHEAEANPRTGVRWHWSSESAALRVWNGGRDVRVRLSIESPLQTFEEAPIVTLKAGSRELARLEPRDAFTIDVAVPASALAEAGGRLTLETTKVFVPAEHVGPRDPRRDDRRRLGLRVFDVSVVPAS